MFFKPTSDVTSEGHAFRFPESKRKKNPAFSPAVLLSPLQFRINSGFTDMALAATVSDVRTNAKRRWQFHSTHKTKLQSTPLRAQIYSMHFDNKFPEWRSNLSINLFSPSPFVPSLFLVLAKKFTHVTMHAYSNCVLMYVCMYILVGT